MNKKRKREILIFAVLIIILGTWRFGGFQQIYLSPSKVMYACERGLHYGPSKKVLLEYKQGRDCLVIGKVDDRTLSVVPARKTLLGMWKMKSGMITAMNGINYISAFVVYINIFYIVPFVIVRHFILNVIKTVFVNICFYSFRFFKIRHSIVLVFKYK